MRVPVLATLIILGGTLATSVCFPQECETWPPISLHPDNPHYFLFRGKPTVLITSGEHETDHVDGREQFDQEGGTWRFSSPLFDVDIPLRVRKYEAREQHPSRKVPLA